MQTFKYLNFFNIIMSEYYEIEEKFFKIHPWIPAFAKSKKNEYGKIALSLYPFKDGTKEITFFTRNGKKIVRLYYEQQEVVKSPNIIIEDEDDDLF
ncbi:MAG: hypothetical protein ACTSQ8_07825 [Candidatus Helarchaeota archaeon]